LNVQALDDPLMGLVVPGLSCLNTPKLNPWRNWMMSVSNTSEAISRQSRREFLVKSSLAAGVSLAGGAALGNLWSATAPLSATARIRISSCRVGLKEAKQAGLDGVEISVGNAADKLHIADPAVRQQYKAEMAETGLAISSFMMGLLNSNPLAIDPRGPAWLEQCIDAARDLGAGVILVAFFGKGTLLQDGQLKQTDLDVVVRRLKDAAPRAKEARVILAVENTLSGQQNAQILERVGHSAVRIYYDVGNSHRNGYDVPAEIRFLKDRIACIHFKDGSNYLGEGAIQFTPVAAAVQDIGYKGWIVMETANPSKDAVADAKRNAAFIRGLLP
jgi:L-ribulose-5-phosphate 3-epimerase